MVTRDTPYPEGTPCWADLSVNDVKKATAFYEGLFDWDIQVGPPEAGGYSMANLGGKAVAGIGPKMGPPDQPTVWMTYLAVADADATTAKIRSAGGQVLVEPMDVMDVGRMVIAMDTAGAVFGLWQPRNFPGAQLVNEAGAITWNEQMSRDFEGSKAFYAAVFGYEYNDMSGGGFSYATFRVGGKDVGGMGGLPSDVPAEVPAAWTVYFGATDTDASVARVEGNGGTVIRPAEDSPYGRLASVADDQGAVFSLISVSPE